MIRLFHGNKPIVRAIEVSIGVFTPDTIFMFVSDSFR